MARLNRFAFIAITVVFHLVYMYSIFDIYFVSPIVHGMQSYSVARAPGVKPPADRLVLMVGDGLRADKSFQYLRDPSPADPSAPDAYTPRPLMPFLRSRVQEHGTFGVSHTRVPTESRPGHVALIAGLYEDVSAVMTGWKLNPVNFDSVFNRSRHTWSWGSPDILPMFKEGAVPGRVYADSYGEEFEDFTTDAMQLDTWVFDKVTAMFENAKTNSQLAEDLRQDKNVFFLHLLGLDTTGHSYRPHSKEYYNNIKLVDRGIEQVQRQFNEFFGDDRTVFVFTADHGMSDWGSHGDGHPDNTRTPLVAWGSGIKKPVKVANGMAPGHEDGYSSDWNLDDISRWDVNQADIAALMAYLVGLDFPTNSVGELPLPYLEADIAEQAVASLANTKAILEMYRVKEQEKRASEISYKPYHAFADDSLALDERIHAIQTELDNKDYDKAISDSRALLRLGLDALRYLQTYDWLFLRVLVTLGYLGYIFFGLTTVIATHVLQQSSTATRSIASLSLFSSVFVGLMSYLYMRQVPLSHYLYVPFPVFFWEEVFARRETLYRGVNKLFSQTSGGRILSWETLFATLFTFGFLETMIYAYFTRETLSVVYIIGAFWPWIYGKAFAQSNASLMLSWLVSCFVMSIFTLLPAIKVEDANTITLGGLLMTIIGLLYLIYEPKISALQRTDQIAKANGLSRLFIGLQTGLIILSTIVTRSSALSIQAKQGLPLGNQVVGWVVLVSSFFVPFLHSLQPNPHYLHRLVIVFLTFSPSFIILTISYEGLFFFAFTFTLLSWIRLEHHVYTFQTRNLAAPPSPTPTLKTFDKAVDDMVTQITATDETARQTYRPLALRDVRVALFFLFFLQSAFFSTGNIASVSSFSLDSVYRLIPVFSPFAQGALLIVKLLIPFALISANLGILNRRLGVAPSALFMLVMSLSDLGTLNFFWLVRDEGSWLDIGTSISHFAISSLLCVFVAGLEPVSELFISGVELESEVEIARRKKDKAVKSEKNGTAKAKSKTNGTVSNGQSR